jgi:hypothetical protein
MYMFSLQIKGQILKECLGESQAGGVEDGKYLHRQPHHVRKYIMSAGWVFPGWIHWSRWFKDNYGVYLDQKYPGILGKLVCVPKRMRDKIILPELMKMEGL